MRTVFGRFYTATLAAGLACQVACANRATPPALIADAGSGRATDTADTSLPSGPTLFCLVEADRFRFAAAGTYAMRLVSATFGPIANASLCIENPPVPDQGCEQIVHPPFPDVWTKTVYDANQLTIWAAEGANGTGQMQTDCTADSKMRSYATFHNASHTAEFTFLVERVEPVP